MLKLVVGLTLLLLILVSEVTFIVALVFLIKSQYELPIALVSAVGATLLYLSRLSYTLNESRKYIIR